MNSGKTKAENNTISRLWQQLDLDPTVVSLGILYILMLIFFSIISPHFFALQNATSIMNNLVIMGLMAIGQMVVILTKGLDLSVGSMLGLSVVFVVTGYNLGLPIYLVIILALFFGALLGMINGFIITRIGINPIITTLGTMSIYRGLCYLIIEEGNRRIMHEGFMYMGRHLVGGFLPLPIIYMAVFYFAMWIIFKYTQLGRNLFTVGSNIVASRFIGLKVEKYQFISYVISGLMSAVAAVIMTAQLGCGLPSSGVGMELMVITAVVLGGVSLAGGRGTLTGVVLAVLILATIANGLVLLDVPIYWRRVARGLLLVIAISIDVLRRQESKREKLA